MNWSLMKTIFFISIFISYIFAKPNQEIPNILDKTRENFYIYDFNINNNNSEYIIQIAIPKQLKTSETIFLLDGTSFFPRFINKYNSYIVVGIGHKSNMAFDRAKRTYDYLPQTNIQGSGGANDFLTFIKEKVLPISIEMIENKIHRKIDSKILFGHSFGGIFALYTLSKDPLVFDEYYIVSPSIWTMPKFKSLNIDKCPKSIYYLWGSQENNDIAKTTENISHFEFVSNFVIQNPKCNITYKEIIGKTHGEMIDTGFEFLNIQNESK